MPTSHHEIPLCSSYDMCEIWQPQVSYTAVKAQHRIQDFIILEMR